jgi:DNA repair protein RadC
MKAQQAAMFPDGDDLPLFSGMGQVVHVQPFRQQTQEKNLGLFECAVCRDGGVIQHEGIETFCLCVKGQEAKTRAALAELPEARRVKQLQKLYAGQEPDPSAQILRETLMVDPPISGFGTRPGFMSLVELISILWGTLNDPEPATHLLVQMKDLRTVGNRTAQELAALGHGITLQRARRLLAALQIGERAREAPADKFIIKSPADCMQVLNDMSYLEQEQMRVVSLSTKNQVLDVCTVYQGSVHTTVIRTAELFRRPIQLNASACVVAHNHPSGIPDPSPEDVAVTSEIAKAGKLLDIDLLDHLVIGATGKFVSLKERGLGFT